MKWILLALGFSIFLVGCALSGQYITHTLRDGSHVQTLWFDNKNPDALNSNLTIAFHCKGQPESCTPAAQGYGTGEGILLKFFQGGATAAAIGAVGATGGFKDNINISQQPGNAVPNVNVHQVTGVNVKQQQSQRQSQSTKLKGGDDD